MTYSELPAWPDLIKRAEECIARRSRGYVDDAMTFARWILSDGKAMADALTATQTRCTELLEENRQLRQLIDDEAIRVIREARL
jgi:hypothetical protein